MGKGMARGLTAVRIVIVAAIVVAVVASALFNFARIRKTAHARGCQANRGVITDAIEQWTLAGGYGADVKPAGEDIAPYIPGGQIPVCPDGGIYRWNSADNSDKVSCSVHNQ